MVYFNFNVEEIKERIVKGLYVAPQFITWLKKHPDLVGTHRVSTVKGKSGYYYRLNDPYPPTEKQKEVWFKKGYDLRRFIYNPKEETNDGRAD